MDELAQRFVAEASRGEIRIIADHPDERGRADYEQKERVERLCNHIPAKDPALFLEVTVGDPSEFAPVIRVRGEHRHGYRILSPEGTSVPNTIAAFLIHLCDRTGKQSHAYFSWTEDHPVAEVFTYVGGGYGRRYRPGPDRRRGRLAGRGARRVGRGAPGRVLGGPAPAGRGVRRRGRAHSEALGGALGRALPPAATAGRDCALRAVGRLHWQAPAEEPYAANLASGLATPVCTRAGRKPGLTTLGRPSRCDGRLVPGGIRSLERGLIVEWLDAGARAGRRSGPNGAWTPPSAARTPSSGSARPTARICSQSADEVCTQT
jgi:hypothetical protein